MISFFLSFLFPFPRCVQRSSTLGGGFVSSELSPNTLSAKSSILDIKDARSLISFLPESVVLEVWADQNIA